MKKLYNLYIIIRYFCSVALVCASGLSYNTTYAQESTHIVHHPGFWSWKKKCLSLPIYVQHQKNTYQTPLTQPMILDQLDVFNKKVHTQFDHQLFVEKKIFQPQDIIAIHGDFHGDVHSINACIETWTSLGYMDKDQPFKICNPHFYVLFLGDYTDRGWYGAEVLYTILRLKNANPDRVFLVRGNHEDLNLNMRYGFLHELTEKFGDSTSLIQRIKTFYDKLPISLYVGCQFHEHIDYIQCCHGGIEIGFDPRPFLRSSATYALFNHLMDDEAIEHIRKTWGQQYADILTKNSSQTTPTNINGFMWNDFIAEHNSYLKKSPRGSHLYMFGEHITKSLLNFWSSKTYRLNAIFRAHQHDTQPTPMRQRFFNHDNLGNPNDIGVAKIWINHEMHKKFSGLLKDIHVVTFAVSPGTPYNFPFDAFGILHLAPTYEQWRLHIFRINSPI